VLLSAPERSRCQKQDPNILPDGPPLDIFDVRAQALIYRRVASPPANLRQTRKPPPHFETPRERRESLREKPMKFRPLRSRTYQAHFSFENIPQLRQLVDAKTS